MLVKIKIIKARWQIGSGDHIRVMYDLWLCGSDNREEKILTTPLVGSIREDKVVWEKKRNGCYSVKSGYN
jgi:hypothetical protein